MVFLTIPHLIPAVGALAPLADRAAADFPVVGATLLAAALTIERKWVVEKLRKVKAFRFFVRGIEMLKVKPRLSDPSERAIFRSIPTV